MKRTLLVTLDFYPSVGGVSRFWEYLCELLPVESIVVMAPTLSRGTHERHARYSIIRARMITRWLYPHWLLLVFSLSRACRRHRIERIIAAQILPVGTAVMIVARLLRIPFVISAHGTDLLLPKGNTRKYLLCQTILQRAERIIVNSVSTGKSVGSYGVPQSRIEYIYPAPVITPAMLTVSVIPPRSSVIPPRSSVIPAKAGIQPQSVLIPNSKKIILTVGRLVTRKGHEYVLRALPGILAEEQSALYCIIGEGPHRATLEALSQELHIEHAVQFLGRLSDEETARWYDACALFIMTPEDIDGDHEGFGIVYLEAQSFGKAAVGSRTGGVAEAVHDGVTGLLVEPKDVVGIQHAVLRLLRDPAYAQTLGENGRRRVEEEFQWKRSAEKLQYLLSL